MASQRSSSFLPSEFITGKKRKPDVPIEQLDTMEEKDEVEDYDDPGMEYVDEDSNDEEYAEELDRQDDMIGMASGAVAFASVDDFLKALSKRAPQQPVPMQTQEGKTFLPK